MSISRLTHSRAGRENNRQEEKAAGQCGPCNAVRALQRLTRRLPQAQAERRRPCAARQQLCRLAAVHVVSRLCCLVTAAARPRAPRPAAGRWGAGRCHAGGRLHLCGRGRAAARTRRVGEALGGRKLASAPAWRSGLQGGCLNNKRSTMLEAHQAHTRGWPAGSPSHGGVCLGIGGRSNSCQVSTATAGWCAETSGGNKPVRASAQHKRSQKERCMQALQGRQRDTAVTASGASSDRAARGSALTLAQRQGMGFFAQLQDIPVSCLEQCLHAAWRRRLPCLLLGSCRWRQLPHSLPGSGEQPFVNLLQPCLRAGELPHVARAACNARQRWRRRRQRRQWAAWCGGRPACAGPCASTVTECRGLKGAWGRGGAGRVVKRGEVAVLQASLRKSRVCTSAASWGGPACPPAGQARSGSMSWDGPGTLAPLAVT